MTFLLGVSNRQDAGDSAGQSSGSLRWASLIGAIIFGVLGIVSWQAWQARVIRLEQAQLASEVVPRPATVTALGRLEPQGELINLTAPSTSQGSRVESMTVRAGDRVQPGQVIAVLDNRVLLQAALLKAEERLQVAHANLAKVKAGAQSGEIQAQRAEIARLEAAEGNDIASQRATIAKLEAEMNNARADYERYAYLHQQGAISASERDAWQLAYTTAQRSLEEAQVGLTRIQTTSQQQLNQARANLDRIQEVRPVDITVAEAEVNSAIADVAEAQANLAQGVVTAPSAGQVIKIHTRPGESIASEGIVTLGQTSQMMVVAEVYQDDINNIKPGQSATVTTTVMNNSLKGTVERIGLQVERQAVVNEDPAANIDAKVVEVHIRLDDESSKQVVGLTNLQVTATITTE